MRYLVDAQLPPLLSDILNQMGFESKHVLELPKGDETKDTEITEFADLNNHVVITKDLDFYNSFMVKNELKKLRLITTGNIKNRTLFDLLRKYFKRISEIFENSNFVELSNDGVIIHQ